MILRRDGPTVPRFIIHKFLVSFKRIGKENGTLWVLANNKFLLFAKCLKMYIF